MFSTSFSVVAILRLPLVWHGVSLSDILTNLVKNVSSAIDSLDLHFGPGSKAVLAGCLTLLDHLLPLGRAIRGAVLYDPVLFICSVVNLAILYRVVAILFTKTAFPHVGYPHWLPFGSYIGGLRFFYDSKGILQEGYQKYKSKAFQVPQWADWLLIVSGDKLVEELHQMPDDTLSLLHSAKDVLQIAYTMRPEIHDHPYHLPILRNKLTRHLDQLVAEIMDEMIPAFDELIGNTCDETWQEFPTVKSVTGIVARTFNRILVGVPTCRNSEYTAVSCQFAVNTLITGAIINLFPKFMHPIIGNLITRFPSTLRAASVHLAPLIEERKMMMEEYGKDWQDKPSDVLMWLMDKAEGSDRDTEALTTRILVVNAATIHTSSMTFAQALVNLALRPEYLEPLREEALAAFRACGWKKSLTNRLRKMDSFFKESMRLNGLGSAGFPRKALKSFSFSDGTYVPEGSYISAAFEAHFDNEFYEDAMVFNGFRFIADQENNRNHVKEGMVRTSSRFLTFGHGKHSCPGRFIVSYLLKSLMAHIIMNYDIKMGGDGERPKDMWFGYVCSPSRSSKVMFRRRTGSK